MKSASVLLCLLVLLAPPCSHAQDASAPTPSVPRMVEWNALKEHALRKVSPNYPPIAIAAHVEGVVTVSVDIDPQGDVVKAVPASGPKMLWGAALQAAKLWKFESILIRGQPASLHTEMQFTFVTKNGRVGDVSF